MEVQCRKRVPHHAVAKLKDFNGSISPKEREKGRRKCKSLTTSFDLGSWIGASQKGDTEQHRIPCHYGCCNGEGPKRRNQVEDKCKLCIFAIYTNYKGPTTNNIISMWDFLLSQQIICIFLSPLSILNTKPGNKLNSSSFSIINYLVQYSIWFHIPLSLFGCLDHLLKSFKYQEHKKENIEGL